MKRSNSPRSICAAALPAAARQSAAAAAAGAAASRPQPKPRAANPAAQATLLGQFGDWGAYTATPGGKKVCFALAKPTSLARQSAEPPHRANPVYMFISTRPAEKVKERGFGAGHRLSVQGRTPMPASRSAAPTSRCTPRTTAPGSRTRPRRRGWSTPCARAPTWWSRATSARGTADHRHLLAQGPRPGARPRRRRSASRTAAYRELGRRAHALLRGAASRAICAKTPHDAPIDRADDP